VAKSLIEQVTGKPVKRFAAQREELVREVVKEVEKKEPKNKNQRSLFDF